MANGVGHGALQANERRPRRAALIAAQAIGSGVRFRRSFDPTGEGSDVQRGDAELRAFNMCRWRRRRVGDWQRQVAAGADRAAAATAIIAWLGRVAGAVLVMRGGGDLLQTLHVHRRRRGRARRGRAGRQAVSMQWEHATEIGADDHDKEPADQATRHAPT